MESKKTIIPGWQRGDGRFVRNRSREVLPDKEMGRGGMRLQEPDSVSA